MFLHITAGYNTSRVFEYKRIQHRRIRVIAKTWREYYSKKQMRFPD